MSAAKISYEMFHASLLITAGFGIGYLLANAGSRIRFLIEKIYEQDELIEELIEQVEECKSSKVHELKK